MIDSEPLLSRDQAAAALTEAGFRLSSASLARLAHQGSGPPYDTFNGRTRYRLDQCLAWARDRVKASGRRNVAA